MAKRNYSSTSDVRSLATNMNATDTGGSPNKYTTITLNTITGTSNLPSVYPYTLVVDPDVSGKEEIITVLSQASTYVYNVNRASDGSSAVAHDAGAVVKHMVTARDMQEPQEHINATGAYSIKNDGSDTAVITTTITKTLHGIASGEGDVVGTAKTQTLTNKTLTNPTVNAASLTGTITNGGTISGGTISGATLSGTITNGGTISGGTVSGSTVSGGTLSGSITNSGTITGGNINTASIGTPTITTATLSGTTTNSGTITGGTIAGTVTNTATITGGTLNPATLKQNSITVPLAFSSGTGTFSPGGTTTGTATVTFPTGRFTVSPVVVVTCENAAFNMAVSSISATGCTVTGRNIDAANASGTYTFDWIAIQQTSTAYTAGTAQ